MRFSLLFSCLSLCLLAACGKKQESLNPLDMTLPVKAVPVISQDYYPSIEVVASVRPLKGVQIIARVSGFLEKRNFVEGSYVRKGDLLYRMEQAPYQIALRESQANLEIAKARAWNSQLNLSRISELFKEQVTSPQNYDSAKAQQLEGNAAVLGARAALAKAELNLSYTEIRAPFDGWIGLTAYDVGNYLNAPSPPLTQLLYIDQMRIDFNVSDSYFTPEMRRALQNGNAPDLKVMLLYENGTPYPGEGTLTFWNNSISRNTATLQVQALFPNREHLLMPGQFVKVRLIQKKPERVVLAGKNTIRQDQTSSYVYIIGKEGRAELRRITVGGDVGGDRTIVKQGLRAGEQTILSGNPFLRPGSRVEAIP